MFLSPTKQMPKESFFLAVTRPFCSAMCRTSFFVKCPTGKRTFGMTIRLWFIRLWKRIPAPHRGSNSGLWRGPLLSTALETDSHLDPPRGGGMMQVGSSVPLQRNRILSVPFSGTRWTWSLGCNRHRDWACFPMDVITTRSEYCHVLIQTGCEYVRPVLPFERNLVP